MSSSLDDLNLSAGYSVLETLVAIALLATLSAIAAFGAHSVGRQMEVGTSVALLTTSLKEWRERSIRQSRTVVVAIDPKTGRLSSEGQVAALGPGQVLQRLDDNRPTSFLTFLPNGASSGARLAVSSDRWRFEVHIDAFNGSAEVAR